MDSTNLKLAENNIKLSEAITKLTEEKSVLNRKIQSMKKLNQSQAQPLTYKCGCNIEIIPSGLVCSTSKECLNKLASEFSFKKIENNVQCLPNHYCVTANKTPAAIPIISTLHVHQKSSSLEGKRSRKWTYESIATFTNTREIKRISQKGIALAKPYSIASGKPIPKLIITIKTINCGSSKLNIQKLATLEIQPKIEASPMRQELKINQATTNTQIPLSNHFTHTLANHLVSTPYAITRETSKLNFHTKERGRQAKRDSWNMKSIILVIGVELIALLLYRLTQ